MKRCHDYEVELSAMLDGESDPATAITLMDHLCRCPSCRGFFENLRSFQDLVDGVAPALVATPAAETGVAAVPNRPGAGRRANAGSRRRRPAWSLAVPRWAWAAAGVLVVAVGLWAAARGPAGRTSLGPEGPAKARGGVTIELESGRPTAGDEQFIELASAVLEAEPRYRRELYAILDGIERSEVPGESPLGADVAGEERSEHDSGEAIAHTGGRRVLD